MLSNQGKKETRNAIRKKEKGTNKQIKPKEIKEPKQIKPLKPVKEIKEIKEIKKIEPKLKVNKKPKIKVIKPLMV